MYTSPERVVIGGRLAAFAGEVMTDDEAWARGLVGKVEAKKKGRGKGEPEREAPGEKDGGR